MIGPDDIARMQDFFRRMRGKRLITRVEAFADPELDDLGQSGASRFLHNESLLFVPEAEDVTNGGCAVEMGAIVLPKYRDTAGLVGGEDIRDFNAERGGDLGDVESEAEPPVVVDVNRKSRPVAGD
jgi:hypothetical protein